MTISPHRGRGAYQEGHEDSRPFIIGLVAAIIGGILGYQVGGIFIWGLVGAVAGFAIAMVAGEIIFKE